MQEKWCERFELRFGIFLSTGHAKIEKCWLERQFFRNSPTGYTELVPIFKPLTAENKQRFSGAGGRFG
jgi:hypothetical protein